MENVKPTTTSNKVPELISQGAYGCVYIPEYTCKGEIGSKEYVTKIQKNDSNSIKETEIGKKIIEIEHYDLYFSPVIQSCLLSLMKLIDHKNIDLNQIAECDIIGNEIKQNKFQQYHKQLRSQIDYKRIV